MHNSATEIERLFTGELNTTYKWYINAPNTQGWAIDSLLYLRTVRDKCIQVYKEFITQLHIHPKANRIWQKVIYLFCLLNNKVAVQKTNPDYLVIKRLYLYYDMRLVTFGIDKDRNLIIQFPVFIQPYTQQPLIWYQIETVPVPIIDENMQAHYYTHIQMEGPYTAVN